MANERDGGERLTATVGERIGEKAHEGDRAAVERAQAVVDDLRGAGWQPTPGRDEAAAGAGTPSPRRGTRGSRRSGVGWALAAGLGAWVVAGMVGRALRR